MILRKLEFKDAPLMLEWMHDKSVIEHLRNDFSVKTLDDCIEFIKSSQIDMDSLNLAIVDDLDDYMGTISLKNITKQTAEFGIVLRSIAIGKGYSSIAMKEIFNRGFNEMKLSLIYWCVAPENKRAIRFYEKMGCQQISPDLFRSNLLLEAISGGGYSKEQIHKFFWYGKTN